MEAYQIVLLSIGFLLFYYPIGCFVDKTNIFFLTNLINALTRKFNILQVKDEKVAIPVPEIIIRLLWPIVTIFCIIFLVIILLIIVFFIIPHRWAAPRCGVSKN